MSILLCNKYIEDSIMYDSVIFHPGLALESSKRVQSAKTKKKTSKEGLSSSVR